jgi:16S rRNA (cytidine1402-2'-O)-methyltransferase
MLYIVSTPIGNPEDITLRARRVLQAVALVVCEEYRAGSRVLRQCGMENKTLIELNEHTERECTPEIVERLKRGEDVALISDHGTPLLADPGAELVKRALAANIRVVPVPGASSLLAALVVSGFPIQRFRFVGMLPAKKEARQRELERLKNERDTLVLMDAPYRLNAVLEDLASAFGARQIAIACDLTMPGEFVERGTAAEVLARFRGKKWKGEFVIVVGAM